MSAKPCTSTTAARLREGTYQPLSVTPSGVVKRTSSSGDSAGSAAGRATGMGRGCSRP
ncbi:hypothetical protein ACLEPN_23645 [Myxococcus sp. 1LA]